MHSVDYLKWGLALLPFFLAFLLAWKMIPYILLLSFRKRLFDPIDSRKLHQGFVSRLAGVAFVPIQLCLMVITLVGLYKLNASAHYFQDAAWTVLHSVSALVCGLVILFMVGLADDLVGVDFRLKFGAQFLVGCLLPLGGVWVNDLYGLAFIHQIPAWFGMPLTVFLVVFIINAINFIDGIDGLCAGIVLLGVLFLGVLFFQSGAWVHTIFAFITLATLVPFFYYNVWGVGRRKHRIFMGDTGSLTLGFSMAFLVISYGMSTTDVKPFSGKALLIAFSTLLIPMADVVRVVLVRLRAGRPIFQPDSNHIHHKLLRAGLSKGKVVFAILMMTAIFIILNISLNLYVDIHVILFFDLAIWLFIHWFLDRVYDRPALQQVVEYAK